MFGDILRKYIANLKETSVKKNDVNSFWVVLRDIAVLDIKDVYPHKVDSDIAIGVYYDILLQNKENIPTYFLEKLKSNNQERFRVINRNLWSSNSFHPDGLANQQNIIAYKEINEFKKGERIVYIYKGEGK